MTMKQIQKSAIAQNEGVLPLFTITVLKSFSELASDAWKTRKGERNVIVVVNIVITIITDFQPVHYIFSKTWQGKQQFPPIVHKVALFDCTRQTCSAALCWGKKSDFKNVSLLDILSVQNIFLWDDTQSNSAHSHNDFAISLTDHYFGNGAFFPLRCTTCLFFNFLSQPRNAYYLTLCFSSLKSNG